MTHHSDDHTSEDAIDAAIQDMHQQIPRGNRPSARAWNQVSEAAGITQAEVSGSASSTQIAATKSDERMERGYGAISEAGGPSAWTTWVAAALIVAMIGASFWYPAA